MTSIWGNFDEKWFIANLSSDVKFPSWFTDKNSISKRDGRKLYCKTCSLTDSFCKNIFIKHCLRSLIGENAYPDIYDFVEFYFKFLTAINAVFLIWLSAPFLLFNKDIVKAIIKLMAYLSLFRALALSRQNKNSHEKRLGKRQIMRKHANSGACGKLMWSRQVLFSFFFLCYAFLFTLSP